MSDDKPHWKIRDDGRGWDFTPKVVGRPRAWSPEQALRWNAEMLRLSPRFGRWHPRGVFKFKTWEEWESWKREIKRSSP